MEKKDKKLAKPLDQQDESVVEEVIEKPEESKAPKAKKVVSEADKKKAAKLVGKIIGKVIHYTIIFILLAIVIGFAVAKMPLDKWYYGFFQEVLDEGGNVVAAHSWTTIDWLDNVLYFLPKVGNAIIAAVAMFVLVALVNLLSQIRFGLTFKSITLFKVIMSILKWVIIVAGIVTILGFLGVDPTALLISAGVITLVVGLSAQNLISDILAGLFIVIEGEYLIDDIVVIDGFRGKVKSVGIRTTSIEDIGGNVKIVNNSEIKTVVNLTNHKSLAKVTIYIASSENLKRTEEIFESKFPQILEGIKKFNVDKIVYKGVASMDANGMAMIYAVPCFEEDIYEIERTLYREFKYIMDEYTISNNEPYVIYDRTKELAPKN